MEIDLALFDLAEMLSPVLTILYVVLGLGLVIFFHELGHFAVAKMCDVHVERFSIGFGPILWSVQRGETEYALSVIPFGGYVKMLGQDDMDPGQMTGGDVALNPRSYSAKSVPQRMAIISAGVIMNVVTGLMFFALAFRLGVLSPPAVAGSVQPGSPAWIAGIEHGDQITHIDGRKMHSFVDVTLAVALSSGDITVEGLRRSGESYRTTVSPTATGPRRTIGVGPENGLRFTSLENSFGPTPPGTPGDRVTPPLEAGDVIIEVGGAPVNSFADLAERLSRRRDEELDFTVRTSDGESKHVRVGTSRFRSLGMWMDIGQVTVLRNGSPAQRDGLKVGDKIIRVDGMETGTQIDPLRLPNYFAARHGTAVKIEVRRQEAGGGDTTTSLTVTPDDKPGWIERPRAPKDPLSVPAIGVAFPVIPRIVSVWPGSQAELSGMIRPNQTVTKIELVAKDGARDDVFEQKSVEIDLEEGPADERSLEPTNWAYAFWMLQQAPERSVRVTVSDAEQQAVVDLHTEIAEYTEDWYLPIRGFVLETSMENLKADGMADAFAMGFAHTRNTTVQIYLTLTSLIKRDLSPRELHGPIGIAKVGYRVAKEGVAQLLLFLGFLSVNLAVLNFLPIPVLDGGHMVFLLWEGIARRKPSERVMIAATYLGMAFVLSLMFFVIYLDIFVHKGL